MKTLFGYEEAVIDRFPTIRAGLVHATRLANGPSRPQLLDQYNAQQRSAIERLAITPISEIPSIVAWRRAFTRFGVKPTQYRAAVEALLRRLDKQGEIPSISTLVDIGNLVSIRYAMPVAVFDQAGIAGPTTVRFASGRERFTDLGSTDVVNPEPGEVVFVDTNEIVSARRWCWRQSAGSATGPTTTEALIVIEAHHEGAEDDLEMAVEDLRSLLDSYQAESRVTAHRLSPSVPEI